MIFFLPGGETCCQSESDLQLQNGDEATAASWEECVGVCVTVLQ